MNYPTPAEQNQSRTAKSPGREKAPAFQLYASDDILAHGVVALMTYAQLGIYMHLKCRCWIDFSIPADLDELARMLPRATKKEFVRAWEIVGRCFEPHPSEPGRLVHPDLEIKRERQREIREVRTAAANARHEKEKAEREKAAADANASDLHSNSNANEVQVECPSTPPPSSSPPSSSALSPSLVLVGAGAAGGHGGAHAPNKPLGRGTKRLAELGNIEGIMKPMTGAA